MKKISIIVLVVLMLSLAAMSLVGCVGDGNLYYASLRINPEIEMILDSKGKVQAANAINEDGAIVLAELNLVGKDIAEASVLFADKAAELGFMDVNETDNVVYVGLEGENNFAVEEFNKKISGRLNDYFCKNGIYAKVSQETFEKYAQQMQEWGVNFGQAKMIVRVLDMYPEMSDQDVLALSVQERMKLLKGDKDNLTPTVRDEYKVECRQLKEEYADMFALEDEIEVLRARLEREELSQEDTDEINSQIAVKTEQYDLLFAQYKEKRDLLKEEFKSRNEQARQEIDRKCGERKNQYGKDFEEHKNKCKGDKKLQKRIKEWQNKYKAIIL